MSRMILGPFPYGKQAQHFNIANPGFGRHLHPTAACGGAAGMTRPVAWHEAAPPA